MGNFALFLMKRLGEDRVEGGAGSWDAYLREERRGWADRGSIKCKLEAVIFTEQVEIRILKAESPVTYT